MPKPSDRLSSQPCVQQVREGVEVTRAGQSAAHLVGQIAHPAKHGHPIRRPIRLLLEDLVGVTRLPRVEQKRAPLELIQGLALARHRLDVHRVVGVEADVVESTKDRRVLVLASDRLLEDVDLEPAGQLRQVLSADDLATVGEQAR